MTLALVERMKHYGIVPELSFVLGNPPDPAADIESTIHFIRKIKQINPATELVLYIYTPVPQEGSILLDEATKLGFKLPRNARRVGGRRVVEVLDAPRPAYPLVQGRRAPPRPQLRAGRQRLLPDRDRHAAEGQLPPRAQGAERLALQAQVLRLAL